MMFVDASAIAILTRETEADALEGSLGPITSPIAVFEAVLGICRKRRASVAEAEQDVAEFLDLAKIRTVAVTEADAHAALAAFSRYGKDRGYPAQLNLGDCFAFAVAKMPGRRCCSKVKISIRPTSAPRPKWLERSGLRQSASPHRRRALWVSGRGAWGRAHRAARPRRG